MRLTRALGVGLLLGGVFLLGGATAAPTGFTLAFDGAHFVDSVLPAGIRHEGRFTASAPFCTSGTAVDVTDVQIEPLTVLRLHKCDDGSGTVTVLMPTVAGEHGGIGSWQIVEGTGRYADLRGLGSYAGRITAGDPGRFETIVYRTEWRGVVDFDAVAPSVALRAAARKLKKPARSYSIRVALTATDDVAGNAAAYTVDVRAGRAFLAFKKGTTTSGQAVLTLRIRAPRGVRTIQVIVTATDPVGNEGSATASVRLR